MMRLMLCSLSIAVLASCSHKTPEPLDATISTRCDPATQRCVTVTEGFILQHGRLYEDLIRTQAKLEACRAK